MEDTEKKVLVMGTKKSGYLEGFLVFFGGRVADQEQTKEAVIRELEEESQKRVSCSPDDVKRFKDFNVSEPKPAQLFFFRCINPTYNTGEIQHGQEIGSVVAVSIDKVLLKLPDDPQQVTPTLVANALIDTYGCGGGDVSEYRKSGIMHALRDYLVEYHYD